MPSVPASPAASTPSSSSRVATTSTCGQPSRWIPGIVRTVGVVDLLAADDGDAGVVDLAGGDDVDLRARAQELLEPGL